MTEMSASNYKKTLPLADDKTLWELKKINESLIFQYEDLMSKAENYEDKLLYSQLCGTIHNSATIHLPLIEAEIAKRLNKTENK